MATDHELALYVMTGCPYCIKVKRFLADNGVTIPERNISTDTEAEQTLIAALRIERHHRVGAREPALARNRPPQPIRSNMYTSIQSRHFSTSLDAGVQLFCR